MEDYEEAPYLELDNYKAPNGANSVFIPMHDNKKLRLMYWNSNKSNQLGTVLLQQGHNEFIEKYYETIQEFLDRNYNVVAFDWRGQGMSERMINDKTKQYIKDFNIHNLDIECIFNKVLKHFKKPLIGIGHSMGGLIALILCSRGYGKLGIFITPAAPKGINAITFSVLKIFFRNLFRWKFWSKPIPPNFSAAFYGVFHDFDRNRAFKIFNKSCSAESGRALCEIGFPYFFFPSPTDINVEGIKCPTLIIGAGRDRITPVQISKKLKKKLGERSELIIFKN